jgi:subtilisin family serine protease
VSKDLRQQIFVAGVISFALVSATFAAKSGKSLGVAQRPDYVPGEVLVKLNAETVRTLNNDAMSGVVGQLVSQKLSGAAVLSVNALKTDRSLFKVQIETRDVELASEKIASHPSVEYAEPNYYFYATGLPNDPDFSKTWSLKNTGQSDSRQVAGTPGMDLDVTRLWDEGITGSENVLVAVVDTGVDWTHPDLAANLFTNRAESGAQAIDGVDNDRNGFIDDEHGWNFAAKTNNSRDDNGHGTHVSGTIGAVGNDRVGIPGVNWNVSILPVKYLTAAGVGTTADGVDAINYAHKMNARIINCSWVGRNFSQALNDAIESAGKDGILVVAAAGNNGSSNDSVPLYPANYPLDNIVSVAALDNRGLLTGFSNFGKFSTDVAAPGNDIWSTLPGGKYGANSGTSMAAPHVAGVAALMLSQNPGATPTDLRQRLINGSIPSDTLRSKLLAKGRVSAYNSVHGIVAKKPDPLESDWIDESFSADSAHPYANGTDQSFVVSHPGATAIRVIFEQLDTERRYDQVFIQDGQGKVVEELSGSFTRYASEYVRGDKLVVRLKSDGTNNAYGLKINTLQYTK